MMLLTFCRKCRTPLALELSAGTGEGEAQAVSLTVICEPCGRLAMNGRLHTTPPPHKEIYWPRALVYQVAEPIVSRMSEV
jgi:hypothetical protein